MALTLMQIGSEWAMKMLAKTGVYTKEQQVKWQTKIDAYNKANGTKLKLDHGSLYELGKAQIEALSDPKANAERKKRMNTKAGQVKLNREYAATYGLKRVGPKEKESDRYKAFINSQLNQEIDEEVFADIYMTVGNGANSWMKKFMNKMEGYIADGITSEDYERVDKKKLAAMSLHGVAGEITRTAAKPSTMVYIYGALIGSIKAKLGYTIGQSSIYDLMHGNKKKGIEGMGNISANELFFGLTLLNNNGTKEAKDLKKILSGKTSIPTEDQRAFEVGRLVNTIFYKGKLTYSDQKWITDFGRLVILSEQAVRRWDKEAPGGPNGAFVYEKPQYKRFANGKLSPLDIKKDSPTFQDVLITPKMVNNMS